MKIRHKITLLTGLLLLLALGFIVGHYYIEKQRANLLLQGIIEEQEAFFRSFVDYAGSQLRLFTADYSFWDEFVAYIENRNHVWADENLAVSAENFEVDQVHVYTADLEYIYGADVEIEVTEPQITPAEFAQFEENRLTHFFKIKDGVVTEFWAATVHMTGDPDRLEDPTGFFIVGERWDEDHIAEIEDLSGTTVMEGDEIPPHNGITAVSFPYEVHDTDGSVVARYTATSPIPLIGEVQTAAERQLLMIIISSLLLLVLVYVFLEIWVGRPFATLSEGIEQKNIDLIQAMQSDRSEFGTLAKLILELHTITEQQKLERAKGDFVSLVSHELRTPLTVLRWSLEKLKGRPDLPSDLQSSVLPPMESGTSRMASLIDSMLNVSKIETNAFETTSTEVQVKNLIEESVAELKPLIEEKKIAVTVNAPSNGEGAVHSDERLLQIIVSNLLSNATRYTEQGGRITVTVQIENEVVISIENTGQGIASEEQPYIFNKLFRGEAAQRNHPDGTGLGLYITKSFIERLGGSISFTSVPGKTTTFVVRLPYKYKK